MSLDAIMTPMIDAMVAKKPNESTAKNENVKNALPHLSHPPLPYEHSWRYSPPYYTALSLLFATLFFYQPHEWRVAIWRTLRSAIEDERTFLLFAAVLTHSLVFLLSNGVMGIIYYLHLPFFEQFKIQSNEWPWRRSAKERQQYFQLIRKSLLLLAFNQYILSPTLFFFSYKDQKRFGMSADIDTVPHWYITLIHIAISMVVEDTMFYWCHRALHHPKIYGYIHKVHHQYKTSIGIASEYAHPIEFLFSNALPFSVGPMLCGMHYYSFLMWSILRVGETVDGHCGYEFPWSPYRLLPFSGSSTAHDYHHSHNIGNYASFFSYWDRLMGTDVSFLAYEERLAQAKLAKAASESSTDSSNVNASSSAKESTRAIDHHPVSDATNSSSSAGDSTNRNRQRTSSQPGK